jgi:hypothetical protein
MSKRILVIEDQEDNRQILRDLLTSADFEVIEAVDGEAGLAAAATLGQTWFLWTFSFRGSMAMRQRAGSRATRPSGRSPSSLLPRMRWPGKLTRHGSLVATPTFPNFTARVSCWRRSVSTCSRSLRRDDHDEARLAERLRGGPMRSGNGMVRVRRETGRR